MAVLSFNASAIVNVDRTRVIFNANENVRSINLINDGTTPTMVQIWTDEGDVNVSPDQSKTPVISLPPIMKLSAGELRSLRLLLTSRITLPKDRESMYWLNIYQIPAQTDEKKKLEQKLTLPLRIRLKVIVRPDGILKPELKSPEKLRFVCEGKQLLIDNPTPWYMNINAISVNGENIKNVVIAPESQLSVTITEEIKPEETIKYDVINDDGNPVGYFAKITSP